MSLETRDEPSSLSDVEALLQNRHEFVQDIVLSKKDASAIGYLYDYAPREIIEAAGCVPVRVAPYESEIGIQAAREHIQTSFTCGFVNATLEEILQGNYDYLNGIVTGHACSPLQRMHEQVSYLSLFDFVHYVKAPTKLDSTEFFAEELERFAVDIGEYAGTTVENEKLESAIEDTQRTLKLLEELFEFRTVDSPKLLGTEAIRVAFTVQLLPSDMAQELLVALLDDVRSRNQSFAGKRTFVTGCSTYRSDLFRLIENENAVVVADDAIEAGRLQNIPNRISSRSSNPYSQLAEMYLGKPGGSYKADFEGRLDYIENQLDRHDIDKVVALTPKFCDPYMLRVETIRDFVESTGRDFLELNYEHSITDESRVRLRVQSFFEG